MWFVGFSFCCWCLSFVLGEVLVLVFCCGLVVLLGVCWFGCVLVVFVGLDLNLWLRNLLLFVWCGWGV